MVIAQVTAFGAWLIGQTKFLVPGLYLSHHFNVSAVGPMKYHHKASEYLRIFGRSLALEIILDVVAWAFVAMVFSLPKPVAERERKHRNVRKPPGRSQSIT